MSGYARLRIAAMLLFFAVTARATSFIVPNDAEMVNKSGAIVTGTVEGSYVQNTPGRGIETVYELRVDRTLKGSVRTGALTRVVSPGGRMGNFEAYVPGSAHFANGEKVLLFLTREREVWMPTDLMLGKFVFAESIKGEKLLVRHEGDVDMYADPTYREPLRRAQGFLQFIEDRVAGRQGADNYRISASSVTLRAESHGPGDVTANIAPYTPQSYTQMNEYPTGVRWPTAKIAGGLNFYKQASQNISGEGDGGVAVITNGLNAWSNVCESDVNLTYGGTSARAARSVTPEFFNAYDNTNVIEFNDPQGQLGGNWTGSGLIAVAYIVFFTHDGGGGWRELVDADITFQNGYTAAESSFETAMTHEIGHSIGWRHSNGDPTDGNAQSVTCSAAEEDCTTTPTAIMWYQAVDGFQFSPQSWDRNAVRAVYPGGPACCTAPTITDEPDSVSITSGNSTLLSVVATGDATLTYQWYTGNSGNTASPIAGATSSTRSVSPTTTTNYWVRVTNSCGTDDSVTVTVTVCVPATVQTHPAPATTIALGGNTTLSVVGAGTGPFTYQWYTGASGNTASPIAGATASSRLVSPTSTTSYWVRVTNSCGSANSNTAVVTVCVPPAISTHPASQTITSGTAASLSVATSAGSPTLTYQWYTGTSPSTTSPVGGATSSTFNPTPGATTSYWVRVTSSCNGSFVNSNTAVVTVNAIRRRWLQLGDHSGEGRSDVYWHNPVPRQNAVWFMNGAVRTNIVIPNTDVGWEPWGVGDFNGDGKDDIIHHNLNGQTAYWLLNSGIVYGRAYLPTMARPTWTIEAIGDFNNDNRDDVFWRNTSTGETTVWLMNIGGSPGMTILASRLSDLTWEPRAVGDFNGDGRDDIFFRKPTTGELAIWFMNGATATPAGAGTVANLAWDIDGAGDFNGDGRGDIRARNFTTGDTEVWLMNGAARTVVASSNMSLDWKARAYGDFDADGKTDVFWRHNVTGENTIWFMNGAAATPVVTTTLAELVYQPATSN